MPTLKSVISATSSLKKKVALSVSNLRSFITTLPNASRIPIVTPSDSAGGSVLPVPTIPPPPVSLHPTINTQATSKIIEDCQLFLVRRVNRPASEISAYLCERMKQATSLVMITISTHKNLGVELLDITNTQTNSVVMARVISTFSIVPCQPPIECHEQLLVLPGHAPSQHTEVAGWPKAKAKAKAI